MDVSMGIDVACRAPHQASLAAGGDMLWSGWRFRTTPHELDALWARLPADAEVTVVMEPTRNAWVPLAAWFQAHGATVVLVPPQQSADLRRYYSKHTKTDRLDSQMLAKVPLLHPEGLRPIDALGPADPFLRTVRRRAALVKQRTRSFQRLDSLIELLGPAYADVLGTGSYNKTALMVLGRYADPRQLHKLGKRRLTDMLIKTSRGSWREDKADELLAAAAESLELWAHGGLDFDELAQDIGTEVRVVQTYNDEIARLEDRMATTLTERDRLADPDDNDSGIIASMPALGVVLGAGIFARFGDLDRFDNLAGVRSFTGLVPRVDQSGNSHGHGGPTKAGDPGLREVLWLAADHLRKIDPQFAARYYRLVVDEGKHHESALCHLATMLATRIAACWRRHERYVLRDIEGNEISIEEGREICRNDFRISPQIRQARRRHNAAKNLKQRTGRRGQESTGAAPASGPSDQDATARKIA